ncbi:MAG: acyl-phosphate glycerol 3-phosphate acyltransferase [Alphaproteobacteria bacterium]|nr:acyl-phosphate glycerol 3-phosphate acyltransferase [Alphaproteobacteria bacterium]
MFIDYNLFCALVICYFIGSIPCGLLLSKLTKKNDPRFHGSKNIGATNMLRVGGWKIGFVTLIFDITKGFIPIKIITLYYQQEVLVFAILGIICGHLYPIWLKFKGGKGVAAFIGILLGYDLFLFFSFTLTWLLFSILFKYSSFSALMALIINLILVICFYEQKIVFMITSLMIIYKHKENIQRLLKGEESKINLKKKN